MLNNVKDFGACGDGISDDRIAIQTAIDEAVAHNKAGIWFPAGTYRVSRAAEAGTRWSLDLNGVQDFMVMGEGPKSVVRLVDDTPPGNWHVFILRNDCRRIVFRDLVIDGNRSGLTNPDEQSHGIEVESGTEDLWVDGCILRECFGDGMRIVGAPGKHVKRLRIESCLFQTNKRSGLAVHRALEQAVITNCYFDSTVTDRCISIEPSGLDAPSDLVIQGCIINHTNGTEAVSISGIPMTKNEDQTIKNPQPLVRCTFSGNIVRGGHVSLTDVSHLIIQNNNIVVTELGAGQRIPIYVKGGGDSLMISGNVLVNQDSATKSVILLDTVSFKPGKDQAPLRRDVKRAMISSNLCYARSGSGIQILSSDEVAIQNNMVVSTGECGNGILIRSESSDIDNISIRDNDITVQETGNKWKTGIQVAADPEDIGYVSVTGNSIRGSGTGIKFEHTRFNQTPVCALNRIADGAEPLKGIQNLPAHSVIVGSASSPGVIDPSSGGGRWLAGLGDPNVKLVPGNVGDIFQRLDGKLRETFYVKEDNNPGTGWRPK